MPIIPTIPEKTGKACRDGPEAGENARRLIQSHQKTFDFDYNDYTIRLPNMVMPSSQLPIRPATSSGEQIACERGDHVVGQAIGLTAADAAALLGISESHFYCLHRTGRLGPLPVRMGRAVRWPRQELVEWFNAGSPPRCRWQAMRSANN
jgi:excisionase family DNA binding protein